jgi:Cdc6-like AAA superfamily ATPase
MKDKWGFSENPFSIRALTNPKELERLFVDRDMEIKQLLNALDGREGGVVYGISGMRGVGKSTVLNKVLEEMRKKDSIVFKVMASGTFAELDFLQKLLTDVCDQIDLKKASKNLKKEVVKLKANLLYNEKRAEKESSEASIRASIKASFVSLFGSEIGSELKEGMEKQIETTLKPYSPSTITREILQFLSFLKKETKTKHIVIGIDETDKCRFEEAEKLLDSVKAVLATENSHFVFVGTLDFHKNFIQVFSKREEEATLSSIFENIIKIPPLDNDKIIDIINKRLSYYSIMEKSRNPFSKEALEVILDMAEGNPKQLMRLCSEGFTYFGDKGEEIKAEDLVQYFKNKEYIAELSATEEIYLEVVKDLGKVSAISKELFDRLKQKGIEHKDRKQYRVNLEKLVGKKYLTKGIDEKRQVQYMPSVICKHIH